MQLPKRKPIRLNGYDYSRNGAYFVTICSAEKQKIFWDNSVYSLDGLHLSPVGKIIEFEIIELSSIYESVMIDKYVIMPNHIHLMIVIDTCGRTEFAPTLSRIVKQFKGSVTKKSGFSVWQKSFYEHIIRGEKDYSDIWRYIDENPSKWAEDNYYSL